MRWDSSCSTMVLARCALALALLAASGCATVVLGPGESSARYDLGLSAVILDQRPQDLGFGPYTSLSASAQATLDASLASVVNRSDLTLVGSRSVWIPGVSGTLRPEVGRRVDAEYVSARLAERVIEAHGSLVLSDPREADVILFPVIQVAGGITTHREYRQYGYPVYLHEEDHAPAWLLLILYDKRQEAVLLLEGTRAWHVSLDSYLLGFIPVHWFLGM